MKILILLLSLSFSCLVAQPVPPLANYQGRLTEASGNPVVDGTGYEVEVRLWSAATGGSSPLWAARYSGVPLKGGAFNLILGSPEGFLIGGAATNDLAAAFNSPDVYLGITVTKSANGSAIANPSEILPRQQWMTAPFAFRAAKSAFSESIGNGSVTAEKIAAGAVTTDKIAAGTVSPQKLDPCYLALSEQQPSGTPPQAPLRGWQKRAFNNIESVSGNRIAVDDTQDRFSLEPGTYEITATVPYSVYWGADGAVQWGSAHRAALKRISDGQLLLTTSRHSDHELYIDVLLGSHVGVMQVSGIVTISQTETFELVHHIQDYSRGAFTGNAGEPAAFGACGMPSSLPGVGEVYSRITIKALK